MLLVPFAAAADIDSGTGTTGGMLTPDDDWCGTIAAAAPGARIDLGPGDFAGPCWISNSVSVMGHDSHIVYDGASSNVIDIAADDVELGYLSFGPTQADIDAIKIRSGSRISVFGCDFVGVGGISVSANSADTAEVQLVGNTFSDLAATGVYLGCHDGTCASTDFFIANNRFDGVTSSSVGYAIETKLNSWGEIGGNDIRDAQGPGITVYGSENGDRTTVENNIVVGSREAATLEIGGGPALVRNNVVIGGASGGLYVYDYGDRGLLDDVEVLGNTLWGVGGPAITWETGSRLVFKDNAAGRDDGTTAFQEETQGATVSANRDCGDGTTCWQDVASLDLWPAPEGPLAYAGEADDDLPWDFCGVQRGDRTTIGALEPGTPLVGSFGAWAEERCPGIPDTGAGDSDPDTAFDVKDPAPDGCGCSTGGGGTGLGVLLAALIRRRPTAGRRGP